MLSIFALLFTALTNPVLAQSGDNDEAFTPSYTPIGFFQQQFVNDESPDSPANFSIYLTRVGLTGHVSERISVTVTGGLVEPPDRRPRLVDAFVDFEVHPLLTIRSGQFVVPFGLEGPEAIPVNPAIDRSGAIRGLNTLALFRDVGVQVGGSRSGFEYAVALVNGTGADIPDEINPKDVLGRVGLAITENLTLGVSGHVGHIQTDPSADGYQSRYRAGTDVQFNLDPFFFRGEAMFRQDDQQDDDALRMLGTYLLAGYSITDQFEGVVRYSILDPDRSESGNQTSIWTLGANYNFVGNTRLSVNYEFRNDRLNPDFNNMLTVQMQVAL